MHNSINGLLYNSVHLVGMDLSGKSVLTTYPALNKNNAENDEPKEMVAELRDLVIENKS